MPRAVRLSEMEQASTSHLSRPWTLGLGRHTRLEVGLLFHLDSKYSDALQWLVPCLEEVPADVADTATARQLATLVDRTRLELASST